MGTDVGWVETVCSRNAMPPEAANNRDDFTSSTKKIIAQRSGYRCAICTCQTEGNGVLILSEFAGAAVQLKHGAIIVNPYDIDGVAEAIFRAVSLTPKQRKPPMRRLRSAVRRDDVYVWVDRFLSACGVRPDAAAVRPIPSAPLPSPLRSNAREPEEVRV